MFGFAGKKDGFVVDRSEVDVDGWEELVDDEGVFVEDEVVLFCCIDASLASKAAILLLTPLDRKSVV